MRKYVRCDQRLNDKAIELDDLNYSHRQIAEMLGVEEKHVDHWLVDRKPTWIDEPMKWEIVKR